MVDARVGALAAALALLVASSPAGAQIAVFHSPNDDGVDPGGTISIPPSASATLHLYIDNPGTGTATGTVCEDGDGNELCGFDLTLEALGGIQFLTFSEVADTAHSLTSTRMRLNVVEAISGVSGPIHIGDLTIDASVGTTVDLSGAEALDAALGSVPIADKSLISVPDAGFLPLLGSGLSMLLGIRRRGNR